MLGNLKRSSSQFNAGLKDKIIQQTAEDMSKNILSQDYGISRLAIKIIEES
jgi:hypothetical protein